MTVGRVKLVEQRLEAMSLLLTRANYGSPRLQEMQALPH